MYNVCVCVSVCNYIYIFLVNMAALDICRCSVFPLTVSRGHQNTPYLDKTPDIVIKMPKVAK